MHESVDRPKLARGGSTIERYDDAGNGTLSETHANEVPGEQIESVGDEIAEGARRAAYTGENGDLRGPGRHRS